jgi:group I intron endonuclease
MPRLVKDYSKGKIYVIRNTVNDLVYVGSTTQLLCQRMTLHRRKAIQLTHLPLYQAFAEIGVTKFFIELVDIYPCENMEQLLKKEGEYIRQFDSYKNGYNARIAGRAKNEYYTENKETIKEQVKGFKNANVDLIRERKKQEYLKVRDSLRAIIECECGCLVSKYSLTKHKKRQIHIKAMEQKL